MRVLIACEFSGVVREAFRRRGHDAWSCDLLPTEDHSAHHIQADVRTVLHGGWDLMVAHPPCTYLANSGAKHLYKGMKKENGRDPARWQLMRDAAAFYCELLDADIEMIAVENPIMHQHARDAVGGHPTQYVQPWWFGHGETKATGLRLKNLPKLTATNIVDGRTPRVHFASPGPDRWKERSRTLTGIADAMAEQWSLAQAIAA